MEARKMESEFIAINCMLIFGTRGGVSFRPLYLDETLHERLRAWFALHYPDGKFNIELCKKIDFDNGEGV